VDALCGELPVDDLGHLGIKGRHDLVRGFDEGDVESCRDEVLCRLEADEASSHHDGRAHRCPLPLSARELFQPDSVIHRPDGADARGVDARDGRPHG